MFDAAMAMQRLKATVADLDPSKRHIVGVAVFYPTQAEAEVDVAPKHKVLIVRRADSEDAYPGYWEIPGGQIDEGEQIGETVRRELYEETGLQIEKVLGAINDMSWTSSKGRVNVQLNYVVSTADASRVDLTPSEHNEYRWITADEDITGLKMTESMHQVLRDAFEFMTQHEASRS